VALGAIAVGEGIHPAAAVTIFVMVAAGSFGDTAVIVTTIVAALGVIGVTVWALVTKPGVVGHPRLRLPDELPNATVASDRTLRRPRGDVSMALM